MLWILDSSFVCKKTKSGLQKYTTYFFFFFKGRNTDADLWELNEWSQRTCLSENEAASSLIMEGQQTNVLRKLQFTKVTLDTLVFISIPTCGGYYDLSSASRHRYIYRYKVHHLRIVC